jgi:hypothetical protein
MTIGLAGAPLGTGERFRKLSGTLAARGASNPDALAAWIGRRKYGRKGFAKLGHHSHSHGPGSVLELLLADQSGYSSSETGGQPASTEAGVTRETMHEHEHSHTHSDGTTHSHPHQHGHDNHGSLGAGPDVPEAPSTLQTPQPVGLQSSAGFSPGSAGLHPRSAAGNYGSQANPAGGGLEFSRRMAITSPSDILVSRGAAGAAVVRHRRGGLDIGEIRRDGEKWVGVMDGRNLTPHTQQRAALMELLGAHNRGSVTPFRPAMPLQAPPVQSPLAQQFGVPNIRAFATAATGASSGPRMTLANGSGGGSEPDGDEGGMSGLTPKGVAIYKKLMAKGFPAARAMQFAKRAQSFGGNSS